MRIRIMRRAEGEIDGVPLKHFEPGVLYDVTVSIGTYLMATGYAQAVADTPPARTDPAAEIKNRFARVADRAAEHPPKKRRR